MAPEDICGSIRVVVSGALNLPVQVGDSGDTIDRRQVAGVHEEDHDVAGRAVTPKDVRHAVPVVVTGSRHLPVRVGNPADESNGRESLLVHQKHDDIARGLIVPEDVRNPVPIVVARAANAPRGRHSRQEGHFGKACPIHEKDDDVAGLLVVPQDVRAAVAVEIGGGRAGVVHSLEEEAVEARAGIDDVSGKECVGAGGLHPSGERS